MDPLRVGQIAREKAPLFATCRGVRKYERLPVVDSEYGPSSTCGLVQVADTCVAGSLQLAWNSRLWLAPRKWSMPPVMKPSRSKLRSV